MELDKNKIPFGDTKEDKKQRKQFIKDFYQYWETINPGLLVKIGVIFGTKEKIQYCITAIENG